MILTSSLRLWRSVLLILILTIFTANKPAQSANWPLWDSFSQHFIQPDGRVIEHSREGRTVSEAQAYAMFFSLVANDRRQFDKLLEWTTNNLAQGDLQKHLPAWLWGRDGLGRWHVLDNNPASDADLWLAYTLLEAGRLWQVEAYTLTGLALLEQIRTQEVALLPGFGPIVMPAPRGFLLAPQVWRINPSYMVPQHMAYFTRINPSGPWKEIGRGLPAMLLECCAAGVAPDWVIYSQVHGWSDDKLSAATGSYDAIRIYLWAGMMNISQPSAAEVLTAVRGMHSIVGKQGEIPEKIDTRSGLVSGKAPIGFNAALLPYFQAMEKSPRESALIARQRELVRESKCTDTCKGLYGPHGYYYDQALALFGLGYMEQRYRFDRCGQLIPAWASQHRDSC